MFYLLSFLAFDLFFPASAIFWSPNYCETISPFCLHLLPLHIHGLKLKQSLNEFLILGHDLLQPKASGANYLSMFKARLQGNGFYNPVPLLPSFNCFCEQEVGNIYSIVLPLRFSNHRENLCALDTLLIACRCDSLDHLPKWSASCEPPNTIRKKN